MKLRIDVISDVVCPWCFIGKRRLERAVQLLAQDGIDSQAFEVIWRPFQLNPQIPPEGMARSAYVAAKFGTRAEEIYSRVAGVGHSVGIEFAFERIVRQPNTVAAHQLIEVAREAGVQDQMVELLFRAYFLEGLDLTQPATLVKLAVQAGLDEARAAASLSDDARRQAVIARDEEARELGGTGVPFFIFAGQLAVSGAQEAEVLVKAFKQAAAEVPA
jgi:predicted DsbA family dithiol-disulfide isomerase